jgi:hypothetical protein
MKGFKVSVYLILMVLAGLGGAMFATNPGPTAYDNYATERLSDYLQETACPQAGETLQQPCEDLLENNKSELKQLIANNTERENFWLFSIYRTNLSFNLPIIGPLLPSYHFETVGVFSGFHTYKAERQ